MLEENQASTGNAFGDFLMNQGLYDEIEITRDNIFELADLVGGKVRINVYCRHCGENRVFTSEKILYHWNNDKGFCCENSLREELISLQQAINLRRDYTQKKNLKDTWKWTPDWLENDTRLMVFKYVCAMNNRHHLDYAVITNGNKMIKIGQYPSVADLSLPELKGFRKVLSKENEKELKRAIGLQANGIGVGSFVYLRRIFERIIISASDKAIQEGKINKDEFYKARMDEKIKMLSEYLPKALVNNPISYGIISKGIHELSEEECLEYFPVLKRYIIMILRQWETIRQDEEDEKELASDLSRIASKVK